MFFDLYEEESEIMIDESVQLDEFEVLMMSEGMEGELYEVLEMVNESNEEFHNLQTRMMGLEHHAVMSENALLLEEGKKNFMQSAKDWFVTMWKKITAWFQKVFQNVKEMADRDASLIKKHKAAIAGKTSKGVKLYNWTNGGLEKLIENVRGINPADAKTFKGEEAAKKYQAAIVGHEVGDKSFVKEAKKAIRGEEKSESNTMSASDAIAYLETAKKDIAVIKLAKNTSDKLYKQAISMAKIAEKSEVGQMKIDGDDKETVKGRKELGGIEIKNLKTLCTVANQAFGCALDLLRERRADARAAVINMAKNSPKVKDVKAEEVKEEETKSESVNVLELFSL